jgi:hypothetical protein
MTTVKETPAFEATDGSLHRTRREAEIQNDYLTLVAKMEAHTSWRTLVTDYRLVPRDQPALEWGSGLIVTKGQYVLRSAPSLICYLSRLFPGDSPTDADEWIGPLPE